MSSFLVSYQLNKQKDYQTLWDEMSRLHAFKTMNSVYLLDWHNDDPESLRSHLQRFIDDDDFLMVVELVTKPAKHRCYKGTQDWIDARWGR